MPSSANDPDLILFGGAFDPPHRGHQQCLAFAAATFPKAKIWMIPGVQPAGARGQHKSPTASFEQRFTMCELLAKDLPHVSVSALEKDLPQPNYTSQTLKHLLSTNPSQSLGLMIGQDQLRSFPKWYEPLNILKMANLIVVRRSPLDQEKASIHVDAEAVLKNLNLDWQREGDVLTILDSARPVTLLNFDLCAAESSAIRKRIANNQPVPSDWLTNELLNYINTHHLYRPGEHP